MIGLNGQIVGDRKDPKDVAKEFLTQQGLICVGLPFVIAQVRVAEEFDDRKGIIPREELGRPDVRPHPPPLSQCWERGVKLSASRRGRSKSINGRARSRVNPKASAIQYDRVSKRYPTERAAAVLDVSLTVARATGRVAWPFRLRQNDPLEDDQPPDRAIRARSGSTASTSVRPGPGVAPQDRLCHPADRALPAHAGSRQHRRRSEAPEMAKSNRPAHRRPPRSGGITSRRVSTPLSSASFRR